MKSTNKLNASAAPIEECSALDNARWEGVAVMTTPHPESMFPCRDLIRQDSQEQPASECKSANSHLAGTAHGTPAPILPKQNSVAEIGDNIRPDHADNDDPTHRYTRAEKGKWVDRREGCSTARSGTRGSVVSNDSELNHRKDLQSANLPVIVESAAPSNPATSTKFASASRLEASTVILSTPLAVRPVAWTSWLDSSRIGTGWMHSRLDAAQGALVTASPMPWNAVSPSHVVLPLSAPTTDVMDCSADFEPGLMGAEMDVCETSELIGFAAQSARGLEIEHRIDQLQAFESIMDVDLPNHESGGAYGEVYEDFAKCAARTLELYEKDGDAVLVPLSELGACARLYKRDGSFYMQHKDRRHRRRIGHCATHRAGGNTKMLKQTDRRKYTHTVASIQGDRLRASCKRVILSRRLQLLSPESERRRLPVITRQSYRVLAAKSIRSSVLGTERSKINQKDVRPISHAVEPEPACSTDEISEQTRAQGLSNVDEAPTVDETGPAAIGTHKQERKSLEKTITEGHNEASSEHCERRPATINDSLSAQQPNSMTITVPEGQAPSSSRLASPEAANTGSTVESPIIKTPPSTLASESNVVVREHDTANDSWLGSNWLVQLLKNPCARTTSDISLQREEFGGDVERRLRRLRELRERLKRAAKHPEGNHRPSRLECIVRGASYLVT